MSTIVRGSVPAEEFVLNDTLEAVPEVELEVERIVESGSESVMPLLWARGDDLDAFDDVVVDDPTIDGMELVADFDEEHLYRMQWIDRIDLLLQMITNSHATVLDAYGADGQWSLRVLYPDRDSLNRTHEFRETHNLSFDIHTVREMEGEPTGRFGLTEEQHTALVTAVERGYYAVPRDTTLEELSEDLGVSHQALSERIRRGSETLIEDALMVGYDPE